MTQVNRYKKECYLTDSEKHQISDFFKELCEVDNITSIRVYLDENNDTVCEIEGIDEPASTVIGSRIKHDMAVAEQFKEFADQHNKQYCSAERFREFADQYNKKHFAKEEEQIDTRKQAVRELAREVINEINEMTKEAGKLCQKLS